MKHAFFDSIMHPLQIGFARALLIVGMITGSALADTTVIRSPYIGITLFDTTLTSPRAESIHVIKIDLKAPGIHFQLSPAMPPNPAGTLDGIPNETRGQKTLDFLKQVNAQFAINTHFFGNPLSSNGGTYLTGFAASMGNVYSSFEENPRLNYAITPNAPGINIGASNNAQIVYRGSTDRAITPTPGGPDISPYNTVTGCAQIITNGQVTIPTYADARGNLTPSGTYKTGNSWYEQVNARTAMGLSEDNAILYLMTVDKAGESLGMTVVELAHYLKDHYGVFNALNLDGGGSTTLAWEDPSTGLSKTINVSSNGNSDREVGASLAIFAQPVPEPTTQGSNPVVYIAMLAVCIILGAICVTLLARKRRTTRGA